MYKIDEDIKSGQLKHAYLIYGVEDYLRKQYVQKILVALNVETTDMNFELINDAKPDLQKIINAANTAPFFSDRRVVLIEYSGLFNSANDEFAKFLEHIPESTYIIFNETAVRGTVKSFKTLSKIGTAEEFKTPSDKALQSWIGARLKKCGKNMTMDGWNAFYSATCPGIHTKATAKTAFMNNMDNEIEKLINYCWDKDSVTAEDVKTICSPSYKDEIFQMINAIGNKDSATVLRIYNNLMVQKVAPEQILSLITRQFKQLLALDELLDLGYSNTEAAKELNVMPFVVQNYLKMGMLKKFSSEQIKEILKDTAETTLDIRSSKLDRTIGMELLMMKYCQ